jgi:hypothetical protein
MKYSKAPVIIKTKLKIMDPIIIALLRLLFFPSSLKRKGYLIDYAVNREFYLLYYL